ncbi:hypothetical protein I4J31_08335 [Corynebacterium belfantii]|nr:hypothetical protein [Corynebacterium belfantii]MBG9310679.1 hypothetical protein [Corynebacterium belfantii]
MTCTSYAIAARMIFYLFIVVTSGVVFKHGPSFFAVERKKALRAGGAYD